MQRREELSIRIDGSNPLHHLWNNHGVWWIHYTLLIDGVRQRRIRYSLRTRDEGEARRLRDGVFAGLRRAAGVEPGGSREGSERSREAS